MPLKKENGGNSCAVQEVKDEVTRVDMLTILPFQSFALKHKYISHNADSLLSQLILKIFLFGDIWLFS